MYSRVSNKRTCTFINFLSIFPPVRTLLGPARLFILKFFPICTINPSLTFIYFAFVHFEMRGVWLFVQIEHPNPNINIDFSEFLNIQFCPVRLFHPVRLLILAWLNPLYVYFLLYVY